VLPPVWVLPALQQVLVLLPSVVLAQALVQTLLLLLLPLQLRPQPSQSSMAQWLKTSACTLPGALPQSPWAPHPIQPQAQA